MGTCPKCGRSNGNAAGGNALCWECYSGRTDAYKNGPKMVGAVPQQKPQQHTESQTIRYSFTGYFKKHWYKNGNLYSGYMQNGYRHGKGKYTRAEDKYTYDGDWYMSKRHGHGKEELPGQWCFEGDFCDNKRNGFGRLVRTDGEIYEGGWKDDKKHGYGKKTFANGNRYEGDWQEGKEHGYGKETFANGNRYEGEFFAGKHSGKGTYYNAEKNETYEGDFRDGKLNGYAVVRYADGRVYEGTFVDNSKTGNGKETAPDGTVTLGHWEGDRYVVDSVLRGGDTANAVAERPEPPMPAPLTDKPLSEPEEKEFDISPESLADFMKNSITAENVPKEEVLPAVELMHDFGKRFCHFDQALYGIDKNGVLHISSRMKKNNEIIEAYDGSDASCLSCYEAANIIILGGNGSVLFADSTWKKGLLADKEIKASLPEVQNWSGLSSVACGGWHFVGLRYDGTVVGAGKKLCHLEEVGAWKSVKAIACCCYGTVGLCEDGMVVSCGFPKAVADELALWKDIAAIACGKEHIVGLLQNGTVVACGKNDKGQCDVGKYSNVGMISASGECTALVFNDGTIKAVGKFADTSIVVEKGIVAAVCANFGNILRLTAEGGICGDTGGVDLAEFRKDFEW